jgi:flagellar biosynthesis protein FlhB
MLCGSAAAFALGGGHVAEAVGRLTVVAAESASELGTIELDGPAATGIVRNALATAVPALLVTLIPALAIGLLVGYGQVGFRFATKALEPRPDKLDPIKGFGRLLGARGWVRLGLGTLKIVALCSAAVLGLYLQRGHIYSLAGQELGPAVLGGMLIIARAIGGAVALFVAIALIDMGFQRFQHGRDLRMTKQEVKEDLKNTEGDPHVRARVRQIQREMASRRMLADVPKATVVVTNPTHVAVALSYERDVEGGPPVAPKVLAKGLDHMAQRIKEIAREAGVPLHEDVPLARSLYRECRVGEHIPERLYAAVATVIGFVYRTRERKKRAS